MLHAAGDEQIVDHVEREQRLHGVIGKALAPFGEAEIAEALGMTEERAVLVRADFIVRRGVGNGHRSTSWVIAAGLSPCVS
jgi:hypothetical protein